MGARSCRARIAAVPRTKVIFICNPNNPTGSRIQPEELDRICAIAGRTGAWVVSDEIYRGAERDGAETATAWGRYDQVESRRALEGYGLPGLRIAGQLHPIRRRERCGGLHDYTTIAGCAHDRLARLALSPPVRARLLARPRDRPRQLSEWSRMAAGARGMFEASLLPRRGHRLRALHHEIIRRICGAAAQGAERPGRAGGPLRHGPDLRIGSALTPSTGWERCSGSRTDGRHKRACALTWR